VKNNKETAPPTKTSFKRSKQNGGQMQMKFGLFLLFCIGENGWSGPNKKTNCFRILSTQQTLNGFFSVHSCVPALTSVLQ